MRKAEMLHPEFKKALDDTDEIALIVTGRKSGRKTSRPVWFVREGNKVYLLPVKGSDTEWFKNVLKNPTIGLDVDGIKVTEKATRITDPAKVGQVVDKFRAKYGPANVRKYYAKFDVAVEVPIA
jgi:hypothetical protein